jgi:hypothetical protein
LGVLLIVLSLFQGGLYLLPTTGIKILGYAANIPPEKIVELTNSKRKEAGLTPLEINQSLSQAALAKGSDMLNRNYWAHVAPDGTEPWKFFLDADYKYRYAGENLARDFSNPEMAIEAWMASPTHKRNILSSKYNEIGVAVVEGYLDGVDTTIIVQHFGTRYSDVIPQVPLAQAKPEETTPSSFLATETSPEPSVNTAKVANQDCTDCEVISSPNYSSSLPQAKLMVSPFDTTKRFSLAVVGILLAVLVIDGVVVSQKKIVRLGGRTFAHMAFLGMILTMLMILRAGRIL